MKKLNAKRMSAGLLVLSAIVGGPGASQVWASDSYSAMVYFTSINAVLQGASLDPTSMSALQGGQAPTANNSPSTQGYAFYGTASSATAGIQSVGSSPVYSATSPTHLALMLSNPAYPSTMPQLAPALQHCVTSARLMMASPGKYVMQVAFSTISSSNITSDASMSGSSSATLAPIGTSYVTLGCDNGSGTLFALECNLIATSPN